jgi:hypothetical protein
LAADQPAETITVENHTKNHMSYSSFIAIPSSAGHEDALYTHIVTQNFPTMQHGFSSESDGNGSGRAP